MLKFLRRKEPSHIKTIIKDAKFSGFSIQKDAKEFWILRKDNLRIKVHKSSPWIFHEVFTQNAYKINVSVRGPIYLISAPIGDMQVYFSQISLGVIKFSLLNQIVTISKI